MLSNLRRGIVLSAIFISYRRSDSEGEAGRLFDELVYRFTERSVFMDVDAIKPGRDFRKAIEENIHSCSVVLVMIGPQWLESVDTAGQRRLEDEGDYLRLEIASALGRDIPVVPVLVRGARMPRADQLPADLQELAYRNAVELTHARWKSDLQVLIEALKPYLDVADGGFLARLAVSGASTLATEAALIERVSRELANYIGPIAEFVVKRAASRCESAQELCKTVAQEIESPADRMAFLRRCQQ
jgi:TIR domain